MQTDFLYALRIFCACLFMLSSFAELQAQSCLPQGYVFDTQNKVDAFPTNFPGCNRIVGDVLISGNISNLNGLANLEFVDGSLEIENCSGLENMIGLGNLKRVGNDFKISNNADLKNLQGLDSLITVLGQMNIDFNARLESLLGLESLMHIQDALLVVKNPRLKNLLGLSALTYSSLAIGLNDSLTSLNGLDAMRHFSYNLAIVNNPSLVDLRGLDSIQSFGSYLEIENNPRLQNLEGISQIDSIKYLLISGNDSLQTLEGLENLVSVSEDLNIRNNPQLKSLEGLERLVWVGSILSISGNDLIRNLVGLDSLKAVGGYLKLRQLPSLQNLDGLIALDSLGNKNSQWTYSLNISYNDSLVDIMGLDSVSYLNKGLTLRYNPLLKDCAIDLLCGLLPDHVNYEWRISGNGYGCDSRPIIMADCRGALAIEDFAEISLKLYPNPADQSIRFDWAFSEGATPRNISVYNIHGELITQQTLSGLKGSWIWEIQNLPDGIYTYRFDDTSLRSGKIVVLHQ